MVKTMTIGLNTNHRLVSHKLCNEHFCVMLFSKILLEGTIGNIKKLNIIATGSEILTICLKE